MATLVQFEEKLISFVWFFCHMTCPGFNPGRHFCCLSKPLSLCNDKNLLKQTMLQKYSRTANINVRNFKQSIGSTKLQDSFKKRVSISAIGSLLVCFDDSSQCKSDEKSSWNKHAF